jgi:hypothetical protein
MVTDRTQKLRAHPNLQHVPDKEPKTAGARIDLSARFFVRRD